MKEKHEITEMARIRIASFTAPFTNFLVYPFKWESPGRNLSGGTSVHEAHTKRISIPGSHVPPHRPTGRLTSDTQFEGNHSCHLSACNWPHLQFKIKNRRASGVVTAKGRFLVESANRSGEFLDKIGWTSYHGIWSNRIFAQFGSYERSEWKWEKPSFVDIHELENIDNPAWVPPKITHQPPTTSNVELEMAVTGERIFPKNYWAVFAFGVVAYSDVSRTPVPI